MKIKYNSYLVKLNRLSTVAGFDQTDCCTPEYLSWYAKHIRVDLYHFVYQIIMWTILNKTKISGKSKTNQ